MAYTSRRTRLFVDIISKWAGHYRPNISLSVRFLLPTPKISSPEFDDHRMTPTRGVTDANDVSIVLYF